MRTMNWWRRLLKWIEKGYARAAYTELFEWGAIDIKEYLRLMKETEDE